MGGTWARSFELHKDGDIGQALARVRESIPFCFLTMDITEAVPAALIDGNL